MSSRDSRDEDLLGGLDDIDWGALHYAYGPANDVPSLLRKVATGTEAEKRSALYDLWGTIWHQGTVYEATAPAVPFLARLAAHRELALEHRASLLYLLSSIAAGSGYLEVHKPLIRGWSQADEEELQKEGPRVLAARAAVARELQGRLGDVAEFPVELRPGLSNIVHHLGPDAASWAHNVSVIKDEARNAAESLLAEMTDGAIRGEAAPKELLAQASKLDDEIEDIVSEYPADSVDEAVADRLTKILLGALHPEQ